MKKIDDILKGFDLSDSHADGTKQYNVKQTHHVLFDYFTVNGITINPDGTMYAVVGTNCDCIDDVHTDLDEFHVYELTEIA